MSKRCLATPGNWGGLLAALAGLGFAACGGITTRDVDIDGGVSGSSAGEPAAGGLTGSGGWPGSGGAAGSGGTGGVVTGGHGGTADGPCAVGFTRCGEECADLRTNPTHCGHCGAVCPDTMHCSDRVCRLSCADTMTWCADRCVDTGSDPLSCGSCANACEPWELCVDGICGLPCPPGLVSCFGMCVDPWSDPAYCGAGPDCSINPGVFCGPEELCIGGICEPVFFCPPPLVDCFGICIDPQSDPSHCGAGPDCVVEPGDVCGPGEVCSNGSCTLLCPPGLTNCGDVCTNTDFDPDNCGGCRRACRAGQACVDATCITLGGDCTNIAPDATASRSSGGADRYGPDKANDEVGESESCAASEMSWIENDTQPGGGYWQLEWRAPVTVGSMFVDGNHATNSACFPTGRDILYAEVQWWDGSRWITDGTLEGQENYNYSFSAQVVTDRIRMYNVYSTAVGNNGNAILFEWYVYSAANCPDPADV